MQFEKKTLPSGLRVLVVPMPSLESVTLSIWVKAGSRNENAKTNGLSHFLEHMFFKGSKNRPSARLISEEVDSFGGEFNAGTSKDWTSYYIKARSENLEKAFDILSDMFINPLLDAKEIEKEKGVITEEISMYEDTPMYRIGDVFEQLMFSGHELGMDIAGTKKTVKSFKRNDFVRYINEHYLSENTILTISGAVNTKTALTLAKKYFSKVKIGKHKSKTSDFETKQKNPRVRLHSKKHDQAHFILGFLGNGRTYKSRYVQGILSAILGGGMSSRLFLEVREKRGLAYAVKTSVDRYTETGYIATYAGVHPGKAAEAVEVILDQYRGLADGRYPITEKELKKAKEYVKGHMALSLEDTKDVNGFFADQELFLDKVKTPEQVFSELDKVTISDVVKEAKRLFVSQGLNLAVIGPYKSDREFVKILNK